MKTCDTCQGTFIPKTAKSLRCSTACRRKAASLASSRSQKRKRDRLRAAATPRTNTCTECGAEFTPVARHPGQKACSKECRKGIQRGVSLRWNCKQTKAYLHAKYTKTLGKPCTYMIIFPDNTFYIGSTHATLPRRLVRHLSPSQTVGKHMAASGFTKSELRLVLLREFETREEAYSAELALLDEHFGSPSCVNVRRRGR